jgi:hypothetical protein
MTNFKKMDALLASGGMSKPHIAVQAAALINALHQAWRIKREMRGHLSGQHGYFLCLRYSTTVMVH